MMWRSQSGQDLFAAAANGFKRCGTYLEIGAGPPIEFNNTYVLWHEFNWVGVSIDNNPSYANDWRDKRIACPIIKADALTLYYPDLVGDYVDYLSIDIEPAEQSLACLKMMIDQGMRFKALTFEHDAYCSGGSVRDESRQILTGAGYQLAVADVEAIGYGVYEDWWVAK